MGGRALAAVAAVVLAGCGAKEEKEAKPVVDVKVAKVERAEVRLSVQAPATIWPREQANIAGRVTAPIRALRVQKGDAVKAGQVLAELENRDVMAQREEAAAAVTDARVTLEKLSAGTLPGDVERARGQLESAAAALNQADKIYQRRQELYKLGAIPGRDLLVSETDRAKAKTDYDVAKKSLDLLEKQSRERDIQIGQSRLEQAEARLKSMVAQVAYTEVRSPFAGTVTEQYMYPGDMANPGGPIFTVMDLSRVVARAQVPEAQAGAVRVGQECEFTPDFGGRVTVVNKAVDAARRTVEVWCEIPNQRAGQGPAALRGNTFGNVTIYTGTEANSAVAPQAAVQFAEGTNRGTVLVVDDKHIAHTREVTAGQVSGGKVQIRSGLRAGELVVVEGGYGLPDGTEVRVEGK